MDASVSGEDFYRLSKALKAAGRTDLRKDLNKALRAAGKPLIGKTRAAARDRLPQGGGLAAGVAKAPQRVQVRTGEKTAGVRIVVANNKSAARAANRGQVRHPVFGTDKWVTQALPRAEGWFDDTLAREAPRIAGPAIEEAIDAMVQRVIREAG